MRDRAWPIETLSAATQAAAALTATAPRNQPPNQYVSRLRDRDAPAGVGHSAPTFMAPGAGRVADIEAVRRAAGSIAGWCWATLGGRVWQCATCWTPRRSPRLSRQGSICSRTSVPVPDPWKFRQSEPTTTPTQLRPKRTHGHVLADCLCPEGDQDTRNVVFMHTFRVHAITIPLFRVPSLRGPAALSKCVRYGQVDAVAR